mmetsp:Transcript_42342/g.74245  ORF Transcript_42342/g.74245 Transcript_42342/m.74245 type:complete len:204 (-) Transcript_42342:597-1208(-)
MNINGLEKLNELFGLHLIGKLLAGQQMIFGMHKNLPADASQVFLLITMHHCHRFVNKYASHRIHYSKDAEGDIHAKHRRNQVRDVLDNGLKHAIPTLATSDTLKEGEHTAVDGAKVVYQVLFLGMVCVRLEQIITHHLRNANTTCIHQHCQKQKCPQHGFQRTDDAGGDFAQVLNKPQDPHQTNDADEPQEFQSLNQVAIHCV